MTFSVDSQTRNRGLWAVKHTIAVYIVAHAIFGAIMAVSWVLLFENSLSYAPLIFFGELAPYQDWQMLGSAPLGLITYVLAVPVTLLLSSTIAALRGDR